MKNFEFRIKNEEGQFWQFLILNSKFLIHPAALAILTPTRVTLSISSRSFDPYATAICSPYLHNTATIQRSGGSACRACPAPLSSHSRIREPSVARYRNPGGPSTTSVAC